MSTSEQATGQTPPTSTVRVCADRVCTETDIPISDLQLEQHIKDCGNRMSAAFAAGDHQDAREWQSRMYAAIRSRTPEHQARLTARIDAAIDSNWFQSQEALDMGKGAA